MKKQFIFTIISLLFSHIAFAEIYKNVDADGRVTYSNIKSKGAVRLEIDTNANSVGNIPAKTNKPAPNKRTSTPDEFPRVTKDTQNQRDDKRRAILQTELEAEKLALAEAKKAYIEGEENPEVYKTASGQTFRNVPRYEEKMKNLKENVDNHQKNIELLQKELDSLR
jgi:hypothetical protein